MVDDALYKRARERAASLNMTVSDVVNQALREVLAKPLPVATKFEMVTFGDATTQTRHEPSDFADVLMQDDGHFSGR